VRRNPDPESPLSTFHIQPGYAALLEANSLATFDALFAARDAATVDGHRSRSVARLSLRGESGETVVLYLKRQWGLAAARSWADLLRLRWPHQRAQREWDWTLRLARAGVPVAEPVAFGRSDGPDGPRALLAVREVRGPSLSAWVQGLAAGCERGEAARRRFIVATALGRACRRLHDAGFCFRDLYAKHVFLEDLEGPEPRVVLIDAQRARRRTRRGTSDDLAALYATTRAPGVRRTDRLRFLRAYLGPERLGAEARDLLARIERRALRIRGRGQDPNLIAARRVAPPGLVPRADERFTAADGGRLQINDAFRPALEAAGLVTFDAVMALAGGTVYRLAPGRSTVRVELTDPAGGTRTIYVKRHDRAPWLAALRRTLSLKEPVSAARREVKSISRLTDAGIPTMRLAAFGEALARGGRGERSCLLTEELAGAVQADAYCERQFGGAAAPPKTAAKRQLVRAIGRLARRFHAAGFVHRDFYLCHILVRPVEGGEPGLHLIDLQRVDRNPAGAPRRWIVKDLAALLFSSWPSPATHVRSRVFSHTDRMRFAREYFGVRRLGPGEKAILRSVIRKARRIARHEARRQTRRAGAQ